MLECQESDHNEQEILYACLNMNCQVKRSCCLYCIQKHNLHMQDLKTMKQIKLWKKNTYQVYEIYSKKITQIVEIMGQAEKYLSSLGKDLDKQFDEMINEEFEKQVCNLLKIDQLSSSFNQLISNLETLMEPISQIFQNVEASSQEASVKIQPTLNNLNAKLKSTDKEQQIQKEINLQIQEAKQVKPKRQKNKIYSYLNLIEKTHKLEKRNDFDIHQYPRYSKSSFDNLEQYTTIILVGTQSSEKQNLINLFVNYYYGVLFSDPYRFEIIDDIDVTKEKQNEEYEKMKVYYIAPQNEKSGLRIIYTPDYSDDLCYDDQILYQRIYEVISNSVSLNQNILIGFVIPQNVQIGSFFMLESILCRFSNKLIKNIVFLFPDCTDEYPKQKEILQSKSEIINGIPSPVFEMMPTMNNFCYLKFNTSALFIDNKTQETQFLWEMGKNSFQLLLQNYLQNKFNYNKLQEMIQKYDEFIKTSTLLPLREKFLGLYKREVYDFDNFEKIQNLKNQLESYVSYRETKDNYNYYDIKNPEKNEELKKIIENCCKSLVRDYSTQYKSLESLTKDKNYSQGFEEFYDLFKRFQNKYNSWRLYFQFNSILIQINHCQWRYYEHLISKEQSQKLEGWDQRVKLLTSSKFCYHSDGFALIPNLDKVFKEWFDQYLSLKTYYRSQSYRNEWSINDNKELKIHAYNKILFCNNGSGISCRIGNGCDKEFDIFLQRT